MKVKKLHNVKAQIKRRMIDVPFYSMEQKNGDLSLDPAKPFVLEQIERIRKSKSEEFRHDLDFHSFSRGASSSNFVYQLPDNVFETPEPATWFVKVKPKVVKQPKRVNLTTHLISLVRCNKFRIKAKKETPIEINRRMRMKFRPKHDAITPYETLAFNKFRLDFDSLKLKPRKRKKFEFTPLPTLEEREREAQETQKIIDDMLRPQILKYQKQQEEIRQGLNMQHTTLEKLLESHIEWKKKQSMDEAKEKKPKKRKPIDNEKVIRNLVQQEREKLKYFEAIMPSTIEDQKSKQLAIYQQKYEARNQLFTDEMRDKFLSLMAQLSVEDIQPYPSQLLIKVLPKIDTHSKYLKESLKFVNFMQKHEPTVKPEIVLMDFLFNPDNNIQLEDATMIISLLIDLQEDFKYHIRKRFLERVLETDQNRQLLQIEPPPPEFPVITIKAPVPWKCAIQVAKNRLDQVLMICHPVVEAVNVLWHELYDGLLIVNTRKIYKSENPLDAIELTEYIRNCCSIAKDIIINDWLPRVADLIDSSRSYWADLVAFNSKYGGRAAIMFRTIHALMSLQLQSLIKRSIDHLFETLCAYNEGNEAHAIDPDNADSRRHPFMTLIVSVVGKSLGDVDVSFDEDSALTQEQPDDPSILTRSADMPQPAVLPSVAFIIEHNGMLLVDPYIEELPEIFVNYFKKILQVGHEIPRMEYFMSAREEELGYLHYIPDDHMDMMSRYEDIRKIVRANQVGPRMFLEPIYDEYYPILSGKMMEATENLFLQETLPSLPSFKNLMEQFNDLLFSTYYLRSFIPLNMFMIDNRKVNQVLENMINEMKNFVTNYFKTKNQVENRKLCDEFEEISLHAGERPKETPEVVALQNYLNECRDQRLFALKAEIKLVAERVMFLLHYATLDAEDIHLNSRTFLWPSELEQVLDLSAARLNVVRESLETALKERRAQFEVYLLQEKKKMDAFRSREIRDVLTLEELKEKVDTVDSLSAILKKCSDEALAINTDENLLQIDQSFFPVLMELQEKMDPIEKLWHTAYQFDSKYEVWFFGPFADLNATEIRQEVEEMGEIIYKLSKALVTNPQAKRTAEQIRIKIDKFKIYLPILEAICREGLSERHWNLISEELGQPINPQTFKTLASLVEIDIMRIADRLEEISNAAGKEFELNNQLLQMQSEWTDVKFDITQYRDSDTMILASVDDIQTLLDDHILKAQAMRGSPYIAALGEKATNWEDKLISMQDILDIWLKVQSTWMYLEPIFNSEDIMRQMPAEGRNFKAVDRVWRKIMKHTETEKRVIQATDYPNMFDTLQKAFNDLEGIQKGLNMYLEKKRLFFARFYFLSNDELLEILSETKDPLRVQPHLKKCFEGIYSLNFDPSMEIIGMVSADGEMVPFTKKINPATANGLVEKWLKEVQLIMVDSLQEQLRSAYDIYYASVRKSWCLKWPGQIVQTISALTWTSDVEEALTKSTLPAYLKKCEDQLAESVSLVRGELNPRNNTTIQSLIILEIHCRDILKMLLEENVTNIHDFKWMAQLRYNWRLDEIDKMEYICVSMVTTDIQYGLEYLGNLKRLILTPLTDRCFQTLMTAIKFNLGGAPEGPAGSGKTETCKDLSKAVGKKCVVFNCSDGLDYRALGKFFKGLAQSGSWACFDEFDRIHLSVLSVVAQQILTIQRAISKKAVKFMFEESNLKLDPTCCIFITINPSSVHKNSLPDNLKVLFRTVALTPPDLRIIAEVTLFSNGFLESISLSRKIVNFLKLTSELMSTQCHYDFGMRSMQAILKTVALQRISQPDFSEDQSLLKAIRDINLPKFVGSDVEIFEAICKDLFPNVELPQTEHEELKKVVQARMESRNLQCSEWFLSKVVQLYETITRRHGVMIIGEPMSGKTTCYQLLSEALRELQKSPNSTVKETSVIMRIINPKAISVGQLYGCFDQVSYEWTDGVLAKTFRDMANAASTERQWIIFDGPVDGLWIENLNTVLDDNKKLCLISGEIIQMSNEMTLLFETENLEQASPATVSRCGMVYMGRENLGWVSIHKSFMNDLKEINVPENYLHLYEVLIEWLIEPMIEILRSSKVVLKVSSIYQYRMMKTFFFSFLSKQNQYNQTWFQQTFLFCFIWAYCSTLSTDGRKEVDTQIRRILYGGNEKYPKPKLFTLNRGQIFPEKMNFLDYRFDGTETWWPWLKTEEVHLSPELHINDVIVPTKESCMVSHWLEYLIGLEIPLFLVGATGSGKTAITKHFMKELPKSKFLLNNINLSASTSAQQVQELVMAKLDRRRKGVFGPPVGKKCLIFIDDLAIPNKDKCGSQPPLELVRQWMDHKHWSDLKDTSKLELIDLICVGAMGLQGGSNYIYERLFRHSFILVLDSIEYTTMQRIYNAIGEWHFAKDYPEVILKQAKALCSSILDVYTTIKQTFLPTPQKTHYTFSMLDIFRVYQGMTLVPAKRLQDSEKLVRLWAHEIYRVFCDRLTESEERTQVFNILQSVCSSKLRMSLSQAFGDKIKGSERLSEFHMRDLIFGNFMEPDADPRIYDEVEDINKLEKVMGFYLNEYNSSATPMNLVLFHFAIEHVARLSRAFQMPGGNMIVLGLGGSGRRSAIKLAAAVADANLIQIEVTKSYSKDNWTEDMKRVLMSAGFDYKSTVFMFSDSQAKDEELFFEDINFLLNSYDLNNIFQPDEKAVILEKMQNEAKAMNKNLDSTPMALYGFFTERVQEKLHLALVFSSIGNSFKNRLRTYPGLRNCCTFNWFSEWPRDAMVKVAEFYISSMDLGTKIELGKKFKNSQEDENKDAKAQTVDLERKLIDMVMYFNKTATTAAKKFHKQFNRKLYVTPTLYLELLHLFKTFHADKFVEITTQRDRYVIGLEKLDSAADEVGIMQKNLFELQPRLKVLSEETERIMIVVERDTAEAEKKKEVVGADEAAANEAAASAQAIKDDCESDLQEAIPALEAALSALDTLKPADITVIKSMKNPPLGVKLVLEAVCVIKGIKSDRKTDPTGKTTEDFWAPSLRMLGDMKFLDSLKSFDKDNIPAVVMKKVRERYIVDREFVADKIKNVSMACEGLCRWVRAMEVYDRVAKIVAPKKVALAGAEAELAQQMEKLNAKRSELQEILDKLQKLNDFFAEKSREKKRLEDEIDNCEKKLFRAERLLGGLGGEKLRWSENATDLHKSLGNIVGDVLLAAGSVAYLGSFVTDYRADILRDWNAKLTAEKVPCSVNFDLISTLGQPMQIRSWTLCGLPSDKYSTYNGIIVMNSRRFPLMIDPQRQANKWIKSLEKENDLQVIKQTDPDYMEIVEYALTQGLPLLLENVGENIDSGLYPILERNIIQQNDGQVIQFAGKSVPFNSNFRFYITTCLRNPHYFPETSVLVTIMNFMITETGLRDQLLATVVNQERPDLQEKKEALIVESAHNRDSLYKIETQILQVLSSSEGNILEDENAINILSSSKSLSEEIQAKQLVAEATEGEIDDARKIYLPVANHSAILFFCIIELANIDPMYQYSLVWFLNLFTQTIIRSPKSDVLTDRMKNLNAYFTKSIFHNICRSLFEKDKIIFSFLMCIGVLRSQAKINDKELKSFLSGDYDHDIEENQIPPPTWISKENWALLNKASSLAILKNFTKELSENKQTWKEFFEHPDLHDHEIPAPFQDLNDLGKLILIKIVRPECLIPAVNNFITNQMGKDFVEPPTFDISASFAASSPNVPMFILSQGSDPMNSLFSFARTQNMYDKTKTISLGQGQGARAAKMIEDGIQMGHWVVLQNCHVSEQWMDDLEQIFIGIETAENVHRDFRLWCTSKSYSSFPVSILQNSVKITNEPPKGLKMNLLRIYNSHLVPDEPIFNNNSPKQDMEQVVLRVVFGLVFFHSVALERKQFGPLGWNVAYEFNDSDLKITVQQLQMFCKQFEAIHFEGHKYLTRECNYGGKVIDLNDKRLLKSILDHLYNENSYLKPSYKLSTNSIYEIPANPSRASVLEFISTLPLVASPEVFGLHENANFQKSIQETNDLLSGTVLTQTEFLARLSDEPVGQQKGKNGVLELCESILVKLPDQFDLDHVFDHFPISQVNSLNLVVRHEVVRYNKLLTIIRSLLVDLGRALKGEVNFIPELEEAQQFLLNRNVPKVWLEKGYNSLKPIGSYIADLIERVKFFRYWIEDGEPSCLWISGFYFTQSVFTAIMLNCARRTKTPIQELQIGFKLSEFETKSRQKCMAFDDFVRENARANEDFKCFYGIFLEAARWNRELKMLDESLPKVMYDTLPIFSIQIKKSAKESESSSEFECPIYKTSNRQGFMTSTGHSTNFLMYFRLPSKQHPDHWIKRGTAALCQLDN